MRRWIFLIVLFLNLEVCGQVLKTSVPFSTATPYFEPDGRTLSLKINDSSFVVLSKTKGHLTGESTYQLEKYDKELNSIFKTNLICPQEEEYKELFYNGTDLFLFSIIANTSAKSSKLVAYVFDKNNGIKKEDKVIYQRNINDWIDSPGKGTVKSTFNDEICATLSKHFTAPFEYQFNIQFSPNKNKVLVYAYDYGQKNLVAEAKLLDNNLNEIEQNLIPIDNGFINYGIYPNNKGEVYILNSERTGRIVLIQYNLKSKANKLLDIQNASTNRTSLTVSILKDAEVYVACINTVGNKLAGIMYAKFDFKQNTIEKLNFQDISVGIQQTADIMRSSNKSLTGPENWANFEIAHFNVNDYEKIILVLEKREIIGTDYTYNKLSVHNPKNTGEKALKINTEGVLIYSFNKDDELLWENYYIKSQINDNGFGITTSSFAFDITDDGRLRMFYPSYESSTGVYNIINYIEWDELTGSKTKEMKAPNEHGISMLTNYTTWWPDRVIVVGRKGLLGKKSYLNLYKLEVN